jgi:hypothetical protein
MADPDYTPEPGGPPTSPLVGLDLPPDVIHKLYVANASRLLGLTVT